MKPVFSTRLNVQTEAAAEFLVNPSTMQFIQPFVATECSVAQAAKSLGLQTNALLYRVNQMLELGLIVQTREQTRAGRAIKYYRSSEEALFVPFALTKAETVEAVLAQVDQYMLKRFYSTFAKALAGGLDDSGILIWRNTDGIVYAKTANSNGELHDPLNAGSPAFLPTFWIEMHQTPEDARAFLNELMDLVNKYHARGGSTKNAFHFGFGPWD